MSDFTGTTTVAASVSVLFDYLSDVANLPRYFSRLTSAAPGEGEEVKTTAKMPDGREVHGDAWFRIDRAAHRLEWGSEGPSEYAGHLEVRPSGEGSEVEVFVRTTRVPDGDPQIDDAVRETLANIRKLAEVGF